MAQKIGMGLSCTCTPCHGDFLSFSLAVAMARKQTIAATGSLPLLALVQRSDSRPPIGDVVIGGQARARKVATTRLCLSPTVKTSDTRGIGGVGACVPSGGEEEGG